MKSAVSSADDQFTSISTLQSSLPPNSYSQQISGTEKKLIFKAFFEGDCKRITMEMPIFYNDLLLKCVKNFGLSQNFKYHLVSEEEGSSFTIKNQETITFFLIRQQSKGQGIIKFSIVKGEDEVPQACKSDVYLHDKEEGGQQNIRGQQIAFKHTVHPMLLLKILQRVADKGQITQSDIKLLNLQNSSLSTQQELGKLDTETSMAILLQCEQAVSEIIKSKQDNQAVKSEGDLAHSQNLMLFSSNRSDINQSAMDADGLKASKIKQRDSIPTLKDLMKQNRQNHNNSNRISMYSDSKYGGYFTNRARTNSGYLETPTGDPIIKGSQPYRHQRNSTAFIDEIFEKADQSGESPGQQKGTPFSKSNKRTSSFKDLTGRLHKIVSTKDEDEISLISDALHNNTILERNESLEISLALNESQINQSYMK